MSESEYALARNQVIQLAAQIAIDAPPQQKRYTPNATVSWELIHALRDTLRRMGFDPDPHIQQVYMDRHKRKCPRIGRPSEQRRSK